MKVNKLENHYVILRDLLPVNYRILIKKEINVSVSLIDKVLRGQMADNQNIILAAYRIAKQTKDQKLKDEKELNKLQSILK
ncbi:MAG: hypothetical protein K0B15_06575 [Lentimicrobium sp.]|nr:hypothetical protein [Lentimicrobium sp.]